MAEPTAAQRKMFAAMKIAMPDGSYYIRNASDLQNAIDSVGRGTGDHDAIRKHIIARAKALKLDSKIPATWNPDGSMKHEDPVGAFLAHYGVKGMQWDHHKPQQDAPFIQRQGQGQRPHFTPQERADRMARLIDLIHKSQAAATQQSGQEAQANPSPQATATHAANTAHLAQMAQAAKEATAANNAHKAANSKKPANHPANKAHAAKMTAKAKAASKAHVAHKAKHPAKKTTTKHPAHKAATKKPSVKTLSAKDKAALAKLKPAERAALAKMSAKDRAILAKMTPQQKKALSGLSQKQKDALHKAQLASAAKRHKDALARKAAAGNTTAKHSETDVDAFLAHFGVKGMHWGVRKDRPSGPSSADHREVVGLGNKISSHGGIHALSNDELQKVINRLNIEQSYHRLTSEPGNADKGRSFVKQVLSDTKMALDAVNTANQVKKAFEAHATANAAPKHQSRRTRNAPLRVVSVK